MTQLKSMPWDEGVWKGLCASVTPMPPFVRKKALLKIIRGSEKNARSRSSQMVEAGDVIAAVDEGVPIRIRKMCLETLAEHGIGEVE